MNFKNSSTWQANSASAADNKMPIEPHTLRAILMCHIKSEHKASATGPTQMCFFQIPPACSWASLFSKHHENRARNGILPNPTTSTWNHAIISFQDWLTNACTMPKTPTSPFPQCFVEDVYNMGKYYMWSFVCRAVWLNNYREETFESRWKGHFILVTPEKSAEKCKIFNKKIICKHLFLYIYTLKFTKT